MRRKLWRPETWEQRKLGDLYSETHEKGNDSLQILSVSIHDGVSGGELDSDTLGKTVRRTEDKSVYKHVYQGNLVFNMMRAWQGAIGIVTTEGMVSPAYITAKSNDIVYPPFMNFAMRRSSMIAQMDSLSYGLMAFRKRLYWEPFTTAYCYVPSVREQSAIADLLERLDRAIALHQRQLDLYKGLKKGYLQQLFPSQGEKQPRLRFANFTGDWEQRNWEETVDISTDMVDPKTGSYDELPHIGPGNIESFTGKILDNVLKVKDSNLISGKFHFYKGDIIYGKINPQLGKYAIALFEGLASADSYILNTKNGVVQNFLYSVLQTKDFYKYSVSVSARTGMPKINRDELNVYNYKVPKTEEQTKIGNFFVELDHLITHHQQKIKQLINLKRVYLQKLFV